MIHAGTQLSTSRADRKHVIRSLELGAILAMAFIAASCFAQTSDDFKSGKPANEIVYPQKQHHSWLRRHEKVIVISAAAVAAGVILGKSLQPIETPKHKIETTPVPWPRPVAR